MNRPRPRPRRALAVRSLAAAVAAVSWVSVAAAQPLPAVPVPNENPISAEKAVLGKILFWEEQLSSDGTVACGTCHAPADGGAEPAPALHPGADLAFGTADDVRGSAGVVRRDATNTPVSDPIFGFARQVTPRAAPNFFGGALWAPEVFWDGRAGGEFLDPLTGATAIATGGALENQALAPLLSDVEMAKEDRTWADVTATLEQITPMQSATDLPDDVADALAASPTYPDLFAAAFGDPAITPVRIAFAIASYERTLVADQTPWDLFEAGDTSALDATEQQGRTAFLASNCSICHAPPLFTDQSFRNVGVRPPAEDVGREGVTGLIADRGRFEVPTLRNVGLKTTFMHNGGFTTLPQVITFYQAGNQFPQNRDPLVPSAVPLNAQAPLAAFLDTGLADPRVADELPPFDRPTLLPEPAPGLSLLAGAGGLSILAGRRRRLGYRSARSITSHVGFGGSVAGSTQRISA